MRIQKSGPVTYGQLSVLRSLVVHGPSQQSVANLISVWEVPPGVGTVQVIAAWLQLTELHESLRTSYDLQGGSPVQIVQPFRPGSVPIIELAEDDLTEVNRLAAEWAAEPIDIEQGPPWRTFTTTYQGEAAYLVAVVHHVAADKGALSILRAQFGQLLGGGTLAPAVQPLDMALAQQQDTLLAARCVHYWTGIWDQLTAQDRDPADRSARRRASVYSVPGRYAAQELADRLAISVQSVVLGVSALAVARLERRDRITFALMAANRLDSRWAPLVSSLNQYAPVTISIDERSAPQEFLQAMYLQSLTAYVNGIYDVDVLRESLRQAGHQESDPTAFAKHFNFLGEMDDEPEASSPLRTAVEWRQSPQRSGPNFHLAIAAGKGLLIGVGSSCDYLAGVLPAVLATSIESGLIEIAENWPSSLREVRLDPAREFE